jgi:CRISPR-associated endonuclease Cas1
MVATKTVSQLPPSHNSPVKLLVPRHGIVTLYGYGIQVRVDRGHLFLEDGIGTERRRYRLPRVNHGLRRLVVIGPDGMVSLAALRWLADQDASFVMLERDGSVLITTGPVRPSDARLRRAQALAGQSETALQIARELIDRKLLGQEEVARHKLRASEIADTIRRHRSELAEAETPDAVRLVESTAASAYWSAWHTLPVTFPRKDAPRVPEHWRTFGARVSPLTGSPRLAVNPPNAMLNYLYAVLESEARLGAAALGLDTGVGVLHVDTKARDSLACDLMEPARPKVDAFLLDWITCDLLKREWFFEQRDGNCRLMASFAVRLSETAPMWGRAVAPIAESVARMFWSSTGKQQRPSSPPTRLTQRNKREAKGAPSLPGPISPPRRENLCRGCGKPILDEHTNCADCAINAATARLVDAARVGRLTANSPKANAKRADTQRQNALAQHSWTASSQPAWLTDQVYAEKIQPLLANMSNSRIAASMGVSRCYASNIRKGRYRPHPRHWQALAQLVGYPSGGLSLPPAP